jgi:hypothetical protein
MKMIEILELAKEKNACKEVLRDIEKSRNQGQTPSKYYRSIKDSCLLFEIVDFLDSDSKRLRKLEDELNRIDNNMKLRDFHTKRKLCTAIRKAYPYNKVIKLLKKK